ncbi:hypothetical protein BABINDRAFT_164593 [Babjeviella inositovora NRRL Y-12698]|uniref:SCA7 domain-containing protein n=1 Tax=Babjeviella inositovora NRRL Y-12698 TaxID=984486 RepID=A0A1E3QYW2_9ASCO|nr:uncharacterized protein BABINDRAFT_164593 [Babjeviella inositovora NRRL Y-12698]ODQ82860.1 hypothetical protein BABINDRAFT_164593 [Babjeviella inositovora NRRL Y-12698]
MSKSVPPGYKRKEIQSLVPDEILQTLGPDYDEELNLSDIKTHQEKPKGSWKEFGILLDAGEPQDELGTNPLAAPLNYRVCNHCNRPILASHIAKHITDCLLKKEKKSSPKKRKVVELDDLDNDIPLAALASDAPTPSADADAKAKKPKKPKKVKDPSATPQPKKPRKEKPKAAPKVKGPVDVEKQCGVPLPNGGFCARSLTCKTHSMGAKRAVLGRSAPYDQLLLAYQRKNQARMAAGVAAAQAARDDMETASLEPLDPDEETHQVLEGLGKNLAYPLERHTITPIRMKTRFVRMREMFASAILPRGVVNGMGSIHGRVGILDVDKPPEQQWVYVKGPQRVQKPK